MKEQKGQIFVNVVGLGLCESCSTIVNMESLPAEAIDAEWRCPSSSCGEILSNKSFGYEFKDGRWNRTKWVNSEGVWTDVKPVGDFSLGNFYVFAPPPVRFSEE